MLGPTWLPGADEIISVHHDQGLISSDGGDSHNCGRRGAGVGDRHRGLRAVISQELHVADDLLCHDIKIKAFRSYHFLHTVSAHSPLPCLCSASPGDPPPPWP